MPLWNPQPVTAADLALKANLASPAFTGTPTAPTAAPSTNTDQIATTAFVEAAVAGVGGGTVACPLFVAIAPGQAFFLYVPAPVTGTLTGILAATTGGDDPGDNVNFTTAIGPSGGPFVPVTGGDFAIPTASTAGTMVSATPTAANATTLGTSVVEVTWDNGGQSVAVYVIVTLFFTPA